MAWIESHTEIGQHPKTKRLARELGVTVPAAIGHLHLLWWWALTYAQDGDLSRYTDEDIADAVMFPKNPQKAVNALIAAGFIDETDGTRSIHDWYEYAGRLIDQREQNRARTKRARERNATRTSQTKKENENATNANGTHTARARDANATDSVQVACGATVPNLTVPNLTVPDTPPLTPRLRGEGRRGTARTLKSDGLRNSGRRTQRT
jgi:hypothetical protein